MLKVLIRGGGDLASGVACRLWRAGCRVLMLECAEPRAIRRSVCFASAVHAGACQVEDVPGVLVASSAAADAGQVNVMVDEAGEAVSSWQPDVLVDARMLKREPADTSKDQAGLVIGLGPGFSAGGNCHAVVETQRGHDLGRVYYTGSAAPNTGIPGEVMGYGTERLLRAPCAGQLTSELEIGAAVEAGQITAEVAGQPVHATISGVLRGLIRPGTTVGEGEKIGDIDPRGIREHCFSVSDKANAVAGGVLEAVLKHHHGREQ